MLQSKKTFDASLQEPPRLSMRFDPIVLTGIPKQSEVHALSEDFEGISGTAYLCFAGVNALRFAGCMVALETIHQPIAYCPISSDIIQGSAMWRTDVTRQINRALRIAAAPNRPFDGAISLLELASGMREVPTWLYALQSVWISPHWDGTLERSIPFCPQAFKAMASRPQALAWLSTRGAEALATEPILSTRFSKRVGEVLWWLAMGDGEKQIADRLGISRNTVHVYVKAIYSRLGVNSRGELCALFVNKSHVLAVIDS